MFDSTVDTASENMTFLSPDEFVRLKEPSTEQFPPSDTLKFSVQIPVYNEMPVDDWEFREHPKLALSLRSLASAALMYKKEGKSVTDLEILCNINNSANERREGNMRAIELIRSFWDSRPIEEVMSAFDWIPSHVDLAGFDEPERNRMVSLQDFYATLISDMRTLISDGMQIHPIDCTDGGVVSDKKGQEISYQKTQGSRRWLMSDIAEHRFDILTSTSTDEHLSDSQYMIPLDADSMVSPLFFLDLSSQTANNHSAAVFILPYEFVKDTGWFINRITEMKEESGRPIIDTFTDKQLNDANLAVSFTSPSKLSSVSDFFRSQGFTDDQINFFESINPRDYLGITRNISAYNDVYGRIYSLIQLGLHYLHREEKTDHQSDYYISHDIDWALRSICEGVEPEDQPQTYSHTFGTTGSFMFTSSAYKQSSGWDVTDAQNETVDLLKSFHQQQIEFRQLKTHPTKITDRRRGMSFIGSKDEIASRKMGIDSGFTFMRALKGMEKKPFYILDAWVDGFSKSITSEINKFDLRDDELGVVAELNPEKMYALPRNMRLQSLLQVIHIADIARDEYPGIHSLVRSLLNPSKEKTK